MGGHDMRLLIIDTGTLLSIAAHQHNATLSQMRIGFKTWLAQCDDSSTCLLDGVARRLICPLVDEGKLMSYPITASISTTQSFKAVAKISKL